MEDEVKEAPRATDMELRDYFAAKVLAQICTSRTKWAAAAQAYEYADAMLFAKKLIPQREIEE